MNEKKTVLQWICLDNLQYGSITRISTGICGHNILWQYN